MENQPEYHLTIIPIYPKTSDVVEMEADELKRLCSEKHLPLFSLKVEQTVNTIGFVENTKTPYKKYFVFLPGVWFTTKEKTKEAEKQGVQ